MRTMVIGSAGGGAAISFRQMARWFAPIGMIRLRDDIAAGIQERGTTDRYESFELVREEKSMSDRFDRPWTDISAHPEFRVLFVRHAESQINVIPELEIPRHALPPDFGVTYPLTTKGMRQAQALGEKLADLHMLAVYSSTRTRCIQTATALALPHQQPLILAEEIVEIAFTEPDASMGMIEENDVREVMGRWARGDIEAAPPGGESLVEVFHRFLPWAHTTIGRHAATPGTLAVVAHGGVLAAGLTQLFPNISPAFALSHMFDNTETATGQFIDGQLVCVDWHGIPLG